MVNFSKLVIAIVFIYSISISAGELNVTTAPPVVIKTFPTAGESNVDHLIDEIHVVFSKEMKMNNMWSVVSIDKTLYPELNGKIKFLDDKRTFVMPVKLQPNKTYAMRFNSSRYQAFKDSNDVPAESYLLVFKTK